MSGCRATDLMFSHGVAVMSDGAPPAPAPAIVEHCSSLPGPSESNPFAEWLTKDAVQWAQCGFPSVEVPVRLAASLMATATPKECGGDIALPWPCFAITLQPGTLPSIDGKDYIARIFVSDSLLDGCVSYLFFDERFNRSQDCGLINLGWETSLAELCEIDVKTCNQPENHDAIARQALLLGRLIIGVCVELDAEPYKSHVAGGPPPKRKSPTPTVWSFVLRRSVVVDVRPWVADYLRGNGKSPTVQTMVRGHRKRQPCGPQGAQRKWITVEPYWRGPEDAPIAVHSHVLVNP